MKFFEDWEGGEDEEEVEESLEEMVESMVRDWENNPTLLEELVYPALKLPLREIEGKEGSG